MEKSGGQQPAHTVTGRLEQAQRWLSHPERDDRGLGQRAIALIIAEGKKVFYFLYLFCEFNFYFRIGIELICKF